MPIAPEALAHGRAVIAGKLGGAKPAASLESLVASLAEAFGLDRKQPESAWPDYVAAALADVDSDLERLASAQAADAWKAGRIASLESILDSFERRANNAESRTTGLLYDSLILAKESDEWRAVAYGLADILAGIPLAILAEQSAWPSAAELHLKAKALRAEEPLERRARLSALLEGES